MHILIFSSNLKYYCIQFINFTTFEKLLASHLECLVALLMMLTKIYLSSRAYVETIMSG